MQVQFIPAVLVRRCRPPNLRPNLFYPIVETSQGGFLLHLVSSMRETWPMRKWLQQEASLRSLHNVPLSHAGTRKFENKWLDPFRIVKCIGPVAYELDLPGIMTIHDVFHVSLLKLWVPGRANEPPPPAILPDGSVEHEVESIIADRVRKGMTQYLVKCLGRGPEEIEWTDSDLLHCQDAVKRYLEYSFAASQATQKRKAVRLESRVKSAANSAKTRRLAVEQASEVDNVSTPMEVDVPAPTQSRKSIRKRGKPHSAMLICI